MHRTPNSTERRIALAGWQCAEVYVRRSLVSLTIARTAAKLLAHRLQALVDAVRDLAQ
jgi:hypothetical protein